MQIDKQQVIDFIRQHVGQQQAEQAQGELPQQVDTEQHSDMLSKYGVNVQDLLGKFGGGDLGGQIGKLFGGS